MDEPTQTVSSEVRPQDEGLPDAQSDEAAFEAAMSRLSKVDVVKLNGSHAPGRHSYLYPPPWPYPPEGPPFLGDDVRTILAARRLAPSVQASGVSEK